MMIAIALTALPFFITCILAFITAITDPIPPPEFPDVRKHLPSSMPELGRDSRSLWGFDEGWTNLNHGSYGAAPSAVLAVQREWVSYMEGNPEIFIRYWKYGIMDTVLKRLARYIGADPADVVFVDNASHGVNAVLRSVAERLPPGSLLLQLNLAYQMVKNTMEYCAETLGQNVVTANVTFSDKGHPAPSDVVSAVRSALAEHKGAVKLVSVSHITSVPALVMPVEEIAKVVHEAGALLLVDGAHALGQIPVDVEAIGADFWVGNGHKWLYSPKGSAILWVARQHHDMIYPTTISQEGKSPAFEDSRFKRDFSYQGTDDPSAFLSMDAALDFRRALPGGGEDAALSYPASLATRAGRLLAEMWRTDVLEPPSMRAFLTNVRLPTTNATLVSHITDTLLRRHGTFVVAFGGNGEAQPPADPSVFYVRLSCQVYLSIDDFEWLGKLVLAMVQESSEENDALIGVVAA